MGNQFFNSKTDFKTTFSSKNQIVTMKLFLNIEAKHCFPECNHLAQGQTEKGRSDLENPNMSLLVQIANKSHTFFADKNLTLLLHFDQNPFAWQLKPKKNIFTQLGSVYHSNSITQVPPNPTKNRVLVKQLPQIFDIHFHRVLCNVTLSFDPRLQEDKHFKNQKHIAPVKTFPETSPFFYLSQVNRY